MDDFFFFICGTVPLIIILRHKAGPDPGPGPWPWLSVLAGGVGGVLSMVIFGAKYAADGAVLPTFLVSFVGGAFFGLAADLAFGRGIGPATRG